MIERILPQFMVLFAIPQDIRVHLHKFMFKCITKDLHILGIRAICLAKYFVELIVNPKHGFQCNIIVHCKYIVVLIAVFATTMSC